MSLHSEEVQGNTIKKVCFEVECATSKRYCAYNNTQRGHAHSTDNASSYILLCPKQNQYNWFPRSPPHRILYWALGRLNPSTDAMRLLFFILSQLPGLRGFVQQRFVGGRTNNGEGATCCPIRAPSVLACSSAPTTTYSSSATMDGEAVCLPFRHCSTVYIEMTDM